MRAGARHVARSGAGPRRRRVAGGEALEQRLIEFLVLVLSLAAGGGSSFSRCGVRRGVGRRGRLVGGDRLWVRVALDGLTVGRWALASSALRPAAALRVSTPRLRALTDAVALSRGCRRVPLVLGIALAGLGPAIAVRHACRRRNGVPGSGS